MNKRVAIAPKPKGATRPDADDWVSHREITQPVEETKRLTIDIPKSLHTAIKTTCATRGTNMADEIRELLSRHFDSHTATIPAPETQIS
jgi:hypothetical protein